MIYLQGEGIKPEDMTIDMSGVQALQSTIDYINFLESEKTRCGT
ncbi:hypothetical protein [Streptococcus pyogenes]|nr:hypothetical protein [Streptococcus pyogenes]VGS13653.1 Uncharacterised protein [Streptococcus pyogenes]